MHSQNTSFGGHETTGKRSASSIWRLRPETSFPRQAPILDLQATAHGANGSSLAIEQLDSDSLSKAADYRSFLPQARNLPFVSAKTKIGSPSASKKSAAKRKAGDVEEVGADIGQGANISPPAKKKQAVKKSSNESQKAAKRAPKKVRQPKDQLAGDQTEAGQSSVISGSLMSKAPTARQRTGNSSLSTKNKAKSTPTRKTAPKKNTGKKEAQQKESLEETPAQIVLPQKEMPKPAEVQTKLTPATRGRGRPRKVAPASGREPPKAVSGNRAASISTNNLPRESAPRSNCQEHTHYSQNECSNTAKPPDDITISLESRVRHINPSYITHRSLLSLSTASLLASLHKQLSSTSDRNSIRSFLQYPLTSFITSSYNSTSSTMSAIATLSHIRSAASSPVPFSGKTAPEHPLPVLSKRSTSSASSDEGWVCRANGQCDLFPKMDLSQVTVLCIQPDVRLFQRIERQPAGKPDHIIAWAESKGAGIIVWSTFASKIRRPSPETPPARKTMLRCTVPTKHNVNFALRTRTLRAINKACLNPSASLSDLGAVKVKQVQNELREAEWHIFPQCSPGNRLRLKRFSPKA
ncbi:hypothetical protein PWT90_05946 [Aphanocladium album]|nr:hypothetical protein PWT90_05946 [Aphanocladium album]